MVALFLSPNGRNPDYVCREQFSAHMDSYWSVSRRSRKTLSGFNRLWALLVYRYPGCCHQWYFTGSVELEKLNTFSFKRIVKWVGAVLRWESIAMPFPIVQNYRRDLVADAGSEICSQVGVPAHCGLRQSDGLWDIDSNGWPVAWTEK